MVIASTAGIESIAKITSASATASSAASSGVATRVPSSRAKIRRPSYSLPTGSTRRSVRIVRPSAKSSPPSPLIASRMPVKISSAPIT